MLQIQILIVFMIIAAVIAVESVDLLGAVVSVGAVGLGLSIAFLFLQAPDLAIVQLVVEILSLIILIRAVGIKNGASAVQERRFIGTSAVVICLGIFLIFAYKALLEIPRFGSPIIGVAGRYLMQSLKETGAANVVTSIILDYRALDTLGEATVLFTAVIGVLAVVRKIGRKSKE
ncbi:MAG: hydrogen gas-evolving membrane-bound hydrogenase subunit E [Elusimicrobiota bacterium]